MDIKFETEKAFDACRNPKTNTFLRFDFYLQDYNVLIEYDGKQHFAVPNSGWSNLESLEELQFRDNYKNEWAEKNGFNLIRIPYTDFEKLDEKYLLEKLSNRKEFTKWH